MKPKALVRRARRTLSSAERRARLRARSTKSIRSVLGAKHPARPILVAGMQRSGTGMLMNVIQLHPEVAVYDEAADSSVYCDFRIRSLDALSASVQRQTLPFAAYKVICDSHVLSDLLRSFPEARVIWMYRRPGENAESQLQKFAQPVRAIQLVYGGMPGGGWLAEGASDEAVEALRQLDEARLSDFDWACLNWWLRNRSYFEQGLDADERVRLLRYEDVVTDPRSVLPPVIEWLGLAPDDTAFRFVHARSAHKPQLPVMDPEVARLCDALLQDLDSQPGFGAGHPTA